MKTLSWNLLCEIEPELKNVLVRIKRVKDTGKTSSFCANVVWYGYREGTENFKETVNSLVGWYAKSKNPVIRTPQAYDLAYQYLYDLLPGCRNCNCL